MPKETKKDENGTNNKKEAQSLEGKNPRLFVTTQPILEGVLQYLGKQPYLEVAHMIDALKQSQPFNPAIEEEKKDN